MDVSTRNGRMGRSRDDIEQEKLFQLTDQRYSIHLHAPRVLSAPQYISHRHQVLRVSIKHLVLFCTQLFVMKLPGANFADAKLMLAALALRHYRLIYLAG